MKSIRSLADVAACLEVLEQFRKHGFDPFLLKRFDSRNSVNRPNGKTPRDKGWQTAVYTRYDLGDWLFFGGNVGFRLKADQLVMDVDPRNNGLEGLDALTWDMDCNPVLQVPYVVSGRGDGGKHFYFSKPPMLRTRVNLGGYRGVDFKRGPGSYVVAPGSLHHSTGEPYTLGHIPIDAIGQAPARLLELIEQKVTVNHARGVDAEVSLPDLVMLLNRLDPVDFGHGGSKADDDGWVHLAMAVHDACEGSDEGFQVFWAWCARDERYAGDQDLVANRWRSFEAGKVGDHWSYRSLLRRVIEAGGKDVVRNLGMFNQASITSSDFESDPWSQE